MTELAQIALGLVATYCRKRLAARLLLDVRYLFGARLAAATARRQRPRGNQHHGKAYRDLSDPSS
ncbi:MAG TPA: hypothetical protein VKB25_09125 [Conexibacter sp.]|nr:hypothetical protein [Conexibacter sp.]